MSHIPDDPIPVEAHNIEILAPDEPLGLNNEIRRDEELITAIEEATWHSQEAWAHWRTLLVEMCTERLTKTLSIDGASRERARCNLVRAMQLKKNIL